MNPARIDNILEQCAILAKNSKCSRRKFGAMITTPEGAILSSGWNGSARGVQNCGTDVECIKDLYNIPSYVGYDKCPAVHAEENAIINAARNGVKIEGGFLFIAASDPKQIARPCDRCRRAIINAGISYIIYKDVTGKTIFISSYDMVSIDALWISDQFERPV